jgi:hypothetical protein
MLTHTHIVPAVYSESSKKHNKILKARSSVAVDIDMTTKTGTNNASRFGIEPCLLKKLIPPEKPGHPDGELPSKHKDRFASNPLHTPSLTLKLKDKDGFVLIQACVEG